MLMAQEGSSESCVPSNWNTFLWSRIACWICRTYMAMTESTAGSIRLNSSKQHHEALVARPLKNLAMAVQSRVSEQVTPHI